MQFKNPQFSRINYAYHAWHLNEFYSVEQLLIPYLAGKKLGSMNSDDFNVEGDRGTLTITSSTEWTVAIYKVTVSDLTSSVPTVETKVIKIRKGL